MKGLCESKWNESDEVEVVETSDLSTKVLKNDNVLIAGEGPVVTFGHDDGIVSSFSIDGEHEALEITQRADVAAEEVGATEDETTLSTQCISVVETTITTIEALIQAKLTKISVHHIGANEVGDDINTVVETDRGAIGEELSIQESDLVGGNTVSVFLNVGNSVVVSNVVEEVVLSTTVNNGRGHKTSLVNHNLIGTCATANGGRTGEVESSQVVIAIAAKEEDIARCNTFDDVISFTTENNVGATTIDDYIVVATSGVNLVVAITVDPDAIITTIFRLRCFISKNDVVAVAVKKHLVTAVTSKDNVDVVAVGCDSGFVDLNDVITEITIIDVVAVDQVLTTSNIDEVITIPTNNCIVADAGKKGVISIVAENQQVRGDKACIENIAEEISDLSILKIDGVTTITTGNSGILEVSAQIVDTKVGDQIVVGLTADCTVNEIGVTQLQLNGVTALTTRDGGIIVAVRISDDFIVAGAKISRKVVGELDFVGAFTAIDSGCQQTVGANNVSTAVSENPRILEESSIHHIGIATLVAEEDVITTATKEDGVGDEEIAKIKIRASISEDTVITFTQIN